jgi:hypothetical protein
VATVTVADTVAWAGAALRRRARDTQWLSLASLGIIGFVAGYVLVGVLSFVGTPPTAGVGLVGALLTIGIAFLTSHGLLLVSSSGDTFDILAAGAGGVPPIAYRAVPVFVLVGLGLYVQWHFGRADLDPLGTALNVVGLTAGYVVMAALATFVFVTTTNRGEPVAFPLLPTVILTALYALAFGVIGAALGAAIDRWRALR